jgi:type II secretory pathway component PulK
VRRRVVRKASIRPNPRRGAMIVFAILALLVVSMLGASLLKTVSVSRQQLQREALHTQANWLADSGAARAVAQLSASTDYTGETWTVPAEQLAAGRTSSVHITVSSVPDHPEQTIIAVTAEYPHGSPTAIRITKRITVRKK